MSTTALGALIGVLGAGALLLLTWWWRARRPLPVADRIGPHVGIPGHTAVRDRSLGRYRPRRVSRSARRESFPSSRLAVWTVSGATAGAAAGGLLTADDPRVLAWIALSAAGAIAGRWSCELQLRHRITRRRRLMEEQVPVLSDLLSLAVSAGAPPVVALERSAVHLQGPVEEDVSDCLARVRAGQPVESALTSWGEDAGVPALRRLTESMAVSLERGSPLAEVLRAQATDARSEERRRLMEVAGRKDVAMLVPIVFLVLPTVVLIAIFPGLRALEVVVP